MIDKDALRKNMRHAMGALMRELDAAIKAYERNPCRNTAVTLRIIVKRFHRLEFIDDKTAVDLFAETDHWLIREPPSPPDPARAAGGYARAKKLSHERRREIAVQAAKRRWGS